MYRPSAATATATLLLGASLAAAWVHAARIPGGIEQIMPEYVYEVTLTQRFVGRGDTVTLRATLPSNDDRQTVLSEQHESGGLRFHADTDGLNRIGTWVERGAKGRRQVSVRVEVRLRGQRFDLDPSIRLEDAQAPANSRWVQPTDVIQASAPEVGALADELVPADGSLLGFARAAYERVQALGFKPFKGTTDALTALRLGEASCNGRSRLLVALFRAQGIAARLVGGLILRPGTKRTGHQWMEFRAGGRWLPIDATNHHFLEIPHHYLTLYRGDESVFHHTANIGFDYRWTIARHLVPRQVLEHKRGATGLWTFFDALGIPLELLTSLIMIPVGAIVIILFRNVVGLRTYGTFLPVLISTAARNTGFAWGAVGFVAIILVISVLRRALGRLQLLHSPQLAVLLTAVIGLLLGGAVLGARLGASGLGRISLFPVAILAITSERFALTTIEEGALTAWAVLAQTLVAVFFCYLTIQSLTLQVLFLSLPELLIAVAAVDIYIGRWAGMRLSELIRFRGLLATGGQAA